MKILVLNVGSSSIKFGLYDKKNDALLIKGGIDRLGKEDAKFYSKSFYTAPDGIGEISEATPTEIKSVHNAIPFIIDFLLKNKYLKNLKELSAIGHRVVHGGELYKSAALVTDKVIADILHLAKFAPLHNPFNLEGITTCEKLLRIPNIAVFDTAFHQTMEKKVFLYGVAPALYDQYKIRKYGFHGINHKYCSIRAAEILKKTPHRLITCHLGNGSSVTAIKEGISIDTSMGFTPTDGLIMGTRSGALDPEVVLYLMHELKKSPAKIDEFLNKESGLRSIAGSSDMREIWKNAINGEEKANLALDMLSYRILRFIGGYVATLNGLDCLVFTGGIGENAWYIRAKVCNNLGYLGLKLGPEKNRESQELISSQDSKITVLVIPANEELQIGREAAALL